MLKLSLISIADFHNLFWIYDIPYLTVFLMSLFQAALTLLCWNLSSLLLSSLEFRIRHFTSSSDDVDRCEVDLSRALVVSIILIDTCDLSPRLSSSNASALEDLLQSKSQINALQPACLLLNSPLVQCLHLFHMPCHTAVPSWSSGGFLVMSTKINISGTKIHYSHTLLSQLTPNQAPHC